MLLLLLLFISINSGEFIITTPFVTVKMKRYSKTTLFHLETVLMLKQSPTGSNTISHLLDVLV